MTTQNLEGCVAQLEFIHDHLTQQDLEGLTYEMASLACVKEFEVIVGLSTTLLRRRLVPLLTPDVGLSRTDVFRHAARHGLISTHQCARWTNYWDMSHDSAYRRVEDFENNTLPWLPQFIDDVRDLVEILE